MTDSEIIAEYQHLLDEYFATQEQGKSTEEIFGRIDYFQTKHATVINEWRKSRVAKVLIWGNSAAVLDTLPKI